MPRRNIGILTRLGGAAANCLDKGVFGVTIAARGDLAPPKKKPGHGPQGLGRGSSQYNFPTP